MSHAAAPRMLLEAAHAVRDTALLSEILLMVAQTRLSDEETTDLSNRMGRIPHERLRHDR